MGRMDESGEMHPDTEGPAERSRRLADETANRLAQASEELERRQRLGEAEDSAQARAGSRGAVPYRSIRSRGAEDQRRAVELGYDSVEQMAIDELGQAYAELKERVDTLARIVASMPTDTELGRAR